MGGAVILGEERENLCRRARDGEITDANLAWVVEAQGLPNLVHELVHALFLGRLADDHGFDYGLIPLDLDQPEQRRHLWEELACCVLSVELAAPFEPDPGRFAAAWFAEQFEIQGVFHGREGDLADFRAYIDAQLTCPDRYAELQATVAEGRARVRQALAAVGAVCDAPVEEPNTIWARYRATW